MTEALTEREREQLIEQLYRQRAGFGLATRFDAEAHERSRSCGDEVTVRLSLTDRAIIGYSWEGHGCAVSMASAASLSTLVPLHDFDALAQRFFAMVAAGGEPDERFGDAEAFAGIGRFPLRAGCASLAWRAVLSALAEPSLA